METFKVAITTRNRPECFAKVYKAVLKYVKPSDVIVVDDASDEVYAESTYRFDARVGIPRSKNKCIELFMKSDGEYLFLLDDDCLPTHPEAFIKYIESGLNHACYTFYKHFRKHDGYRSFRLVNGCMMFFTRKCFETVGGMDAESFGLGKYEHVNLSGRIFNAGLTPARYIDIYSEGLWHCMDEDKGHIRSFTAEEMRNLLKWGKEHFIKKFGSSEYISYV